MDLLLFHRYTIPHINSLKNEPMRKIVYEVELLQNGRIKDKIRLLNNKKGKIEIYIGNDVIPSNWSLDKMRLFDKHVI